MEVEVKFARGERKGQVEKLELEDDVPYGIGKQTRKKIQMNAEGDEDSEKYRIKDAVRTFTDARDFLARNMLKESDVDVDLEDLTVDSVDEIASAYWNQIKLQKKSNDDS